MLLDPKRTGAIVLCLIMWLALLGWTEIARADGTWSVVSLPQKPGEVFRPKALAVDAAGNLDVADMGNGGRIQQRNAQGSWTVLATAGRGLGQVNQPSDLAVDAAGNLYVADYPDGGRIQKRDAQGNWSVIATYGGAVGQVFGTPTALAVDSAGNLYVAELLDWNTGNGRIQRRDAQGNWSVIATYGIALGQVVYTPGLAADTAGNLYVAEGGRIQKRDVQGNWSVIAMQYAAPLTVDNAGNLYAAHSGGIQRRDAQGNWSVIAATGTATGQVSNPSALAADAAGNLYVAESGRIQRRDAQGNWSVIAAFGSAPGQLYSPLGLAVDTRGNLYVADRSEGGRIQRRDARGTWSVTVPLGAALGQAVSPSALAADSAGNLYVAISLGGLGLIEKWNGDTWTTVATVDPLYHIVDGTYESRPAYLAMDPADSLYVAVYYFGIKKRDARGNWSLLGGNPLFAPTAAAADGTGNLYVAEVGNDSRNWWLEKRDTQGKWSLIATGGWDVGGDVGQVMDPRGLAIDGAGNLYLAEGSNGGNRIQKRDAQGKWSVIATGGSALGQVNNPSGLAVDSAGNLYVADTDNDRVLKYTPRP